MDPPNERTHIAKVRWVVYAWKRGLTSRCMDGFKETHSMDEVKLILWNDDPQAPEDDDEPGD